MNLLNIKLENKRFLICTDNEITYLTAYTHNTKGKYPSLLQKIRTLLTRENTLLVKVASHKDPPILGNDIADILADAARDYSHIHPTEIITPDLDSFLYSTLIYCHFGCNSTTTAWKQVDVG